MRVGHAGSHCRHAIAGMRWTPCYLHIPEIWEVKFQPKLQTVIQKSEAMFLRFSCIEPSTNIQYLTLFNVNLT